MTESAYQGAAPPASRVARWLAAARRLNAPFAAAAVTRRERLALTAVCALAAAGLVYGVRHGNPYPADFDQLWFGARVLREGGNPYTAVGPDGVFQWNALFYPLPAVLLAVPFSFLPALWAQVLFMALGVGALAYGLSRYGPLPLLGLVSAPMLWALTSVQWSPLFAAAILFPWLGVAFIAKPPLGLACMAPRVTWWPVVGAATLAALSFAVQPYWLADWWGALHQTTLSAAPELAPRDADAWRRAPRPYLAPILQPGGAFLVLALLRWRRPEARLLLALACMPQTPLPYEALPLVLIPRSPLELLALVAGGWGANHALVAARGVLAEGDWLEASGVYCTWGLHLVALACVLRRPNEGPVPAWLARWLAALRLPRWIAGASPAVASDRHG